MRLALLSSLVLLAACERPSNVTGRAFTATGELVALSGGDGGARNACHTCHGLSGEGDGVSVPALAGRDAGYLQKQLQDYALSLRADPVMSPIAKSLNDEARRAVAAYYAALPAPPLAAAMPPPQAYGRGEPSCATCHGVDGLGRGGAGPAIAGQPSAYTADQLERWSRAERRNDPRGVMRTAAAGLSASEQAAIAAWLERRAPSPRRDNDVQAGSGGGAVAE